MVAGVAVVLAAVALHTAPTCSGQVLHFSLSGALDSPNGVYPLLGSEFNASFDLPSEPRDLISPNEVALYTAATYSNGGITVSDPHVYVIFLSGSPFDAGGIYMFFNRTNWFPNGFALEIEQGVPALYSGTPAQPRFSPGTIDLSGAQVRVAAQGAGGPGDSRISHPVLSITSVDVTPPTISISTSVTALWPPSGGMVPVTVTGTIRDDDPAGSGVNPGTAAYSLIDEYGTDQPTGAIDLQSDGGYAFVVLLEASRRGTDRKGRQYIITVTAQDRAGNEGSAAARITVGHDASKRGSNSFSRSNAY